MACLAGLCRCPWVCMTPEADPSLLRECWWLFLICLKTRVSTAHPKLDLEMKYTFHLEGGKKKNLKKKRKKREREKIYCLDIPGVAVFPSFFPSLSLKDLPSYEFESLRTCLHREIYRPNYASIIRLINLPVYTSLNFKSSIVSKCKPSEQLYFRLLNYACQLWADCRSLWPSFLISKQWGSLDTKSLY